MALLCIEASSRVATVALVRGGEPAPAPAIEQSCNDPRASAEWLAGAVADVFAQGGIDVHTLAGLEGVALGVGPGGLTGLRMATAFVKGLAFASPVALSLIPVNSLAALIYAHAQDSGQPRADTRVRPYESTDTRPAPYGDRLALVDGSKGWVYVAGPAAATLDGATDWSGLATALVPVEVFTAWARSQPVPLALVTDGSAPALAAAAASGWPATHGLTPMASSIGSLALGQTRRAMAVRDFRLGYLRPASDFKTLAEQGA